MFLPRLSDHTLVPLPAEAAPMPGSPADLRIFKDNRMPVGVGPGSPAAAELIWRLMVAMRLRRNWAAVKLTALVTDILIEQSRPDPQQRIGDSSFSLHLDGPAAYQMSPDSVTRRAAEAIRTLRDWKLIGHDPSMEIIWLTPEVFEHCQVPPDWNADALLHI